MPRWESWRHCLAAAAFTVILAATGSFAQAQTYPARPITLVVPLPPGGTTDIFSRLVAEKMAALLGQPVVVENRALGGSGTVATRAVAKGAPDGYTIVLGYTTTLATGPTMVPTAGYDVRKDFAPLGLIATAPALLLANAGVPAKTIQDVIALIKSAKEPYQIGLPSVGSVSHLAAEMFVRQAGLKVQFIPYKASQPLTTDLIAGHVKLGFNPIPVSRGAIEGGLVRAIAGTSVKRSSIFPDLPTIAEAGLTGVDAVLSYGLLAPGGTPQPIVDRLNQSLRATLAMDDVKQRLALEGADPAPTTPAEHAAVIDREEAKFSALIKELGLKPQ